MIEQTRSTSHNPARDWLPLYVAGSLSANQRLTVEAHLATCAECAVLADHWRQIALAVRSESAARADRLPTLNRALFTTPKAFLPERTLNMTTHVIATKPRIYTPNLIGLAALFILIAGLLVVLRQPSNSGGFGSQPLIAIQATPSPTTLPTPTRFPTMNAPMSGLPIAVPITVATTFAFTTPIELGKVVTGQLTTVNPQAYYTLTVPQDGLLELTVNSYDFKPQVRYYQLDAKPITLSESEPNQRKDVFVTVHVHAGGRIGVNISSDSDTAVGSFTLGADLRQPINLTDNQPVEQQIVTSPDQVNPNGLHYFAFDAKAGDILDVRVKSDGNDDLNMYMYEYISAFTYMPIFQTDLGFRHQCFNTALSQQCYDDDSGGGTDPELHNIVVRDDRHFEVIVSAFGFVKPTATYQITVTRSKPATLSPGETQITGISWKMPMLPITVNTRTGETIAFDFKQLGTPKVPILISAVQNNQVLTGRSIEAGVMDTPFTVTSMSNDPVLLFVDYGQIPADGTFTVFSIGRP